MSKNREPLPGADAAWLRMERPTNLMMISAVMMFDEPMTLGELRNLVEQRLLIFHRFRQRVSDPKADPHWEDDPYFELDRHLHRIALPAPGGQAELEALVSDFMTTPLDFGKPPWEVHLVENYGDGCALILRLHHCIADGIALIHVLLSMADESFDPAQVPAPKPRRAADEGLLAGLVSPVVQAVRGTVRVTEAVLHEGMEMLMNPRHLLTRAKQGMSVGAATSKLLLMSADSDTVFKGRLGVVKRAAWSHPVPLWTVKEIGRGVGGKVNDVLLTAVCGALRRYLLAYHETVEDVNIRATIPVNLRPLEEAYKLGNRFGLVFLALPVGIADPEERLLEVKRRMDRIKFSAEAPVTLGILQLIGSAPYEVQKQVVDLLSKNASAVMTNVPGPRQRLHLMGKPLGRMMFWVPRAGDVSTGVSLISYAGDVLLGVATDVRLVPDPEAIVAGFHEEFDALQRQFVQT